MGRRGAIVAGLIVAGVLALVASPRFLPRDAGPVYFHGGSGQLSVTGDRSAVVELRDPPNPVYGVSDVPSQTPRTLRLEFGTASGGAFSFSIAGFTGPGQYTTTQVLSGGDAFLTVETDRYRCYERCGACAVNVDVASRASISGSVACSSMRNCAAARLIPEIPVAVLDDDSCSAQAPSSVDVQGTFLLDQPTDKRRDR